MSLAFSHIQMNAEVNPTEYYHHVQDQDGFKIKLTDQNTLSAFPFIPQHIKIK